MKKLLVGMSFALGVALGCAGFAHAAAVSSSPFGPTTVHEIGVASGSGVVRPMEKKAPTLHCTRPGFVPTPAKFYVPGIGWAKGELCLPKPKPKN